jgi:hypothetical protein
MKNLILGTLIFFAIGCSDDATSDTGCHTAKNSGGDRVFLRCVEKSIYLKGEHEFPNWEFYTEHQWGKCDNCK